MVSKRGSESLAGASPLQLRVMLSWMITRRWECDSLHGHLASRRPLMPATYIPKRAKNTFSPFGFPLALRQNCESTCGMAATVCGHASARPLASAGLSITRTGSPEPHEVITFSAQGRSGGTAYAEDLKSLARKGLWVRIPPSA